MKTLKEIAEQSGNGKYVAPFRASALIKQFLHRAAQPDVSVEELLWWAMAHIDQIYLQMGDVTHHHTVEEVQQMMIVVIDKARKGHEWAAAPGTYRPPMSRTLEDNYGRVARLDR